MQKTVIKARDVMHTKHMELDGMAGGCLDAIATGS